MSLKGKELIIDGETYVNGQAVYELLDGLLSDVAIRDLGKTWRRKKIGNRYYYRKEDVKLPDYPVARWQRMALMYMDLTAPDAPISAMEFSENYYHAKKFLTAARVEMVVTGWLTTAIGKVVYAVLSMRHRYHLVVMDDTKIAGRQLRKEEVAAAHRIEPVGGVNLHSWGLDLLAAVAEELLATDGGAT